MVFANQKQLKYLSTSTKWFIDATFRVVQYPFHQLITIHASVSSSVNTVFIPVMFILMTHRRHTDYRIVFKFVFDQVKAYFHGDMSKCPLKYIMMDFENAMWKALEYMKFDEEIPQIMLLGCFFHFCQAIYRQVRLEGLDYQYRHNRFTKYVVRCLMYLAFLPIDHINHAYNLLKSYMMQFEPNTYKKSKPLYVINKENRSQIK